MPITKTSKVLIIKESIHLFKVQGYYYTTMADIGQACGLIKGSIYHHFKSKEALALACLESIHTYFNQNIFAIAYLKNTTPQNKLKKMVKAIEHYFLNSQGGCLLGNFSLEIANNMPLLKKEIKYYFNHWEQALFTILKEKLDDITAINEAKKLVAQTQGAIMMMRLYESPKLFKQLNEDMIKIMI